MNWDQQPSRETFVHNWLEAYKEAWQKRDPEAAALLFTEDALYQEDPFTDPLRGRKAIHDYWAAETQNQMDVNFAYSLLAMTGDATAIIHWHASFRRVTTGLLRNLDGIAIIEFAHATHCSGFREWWHCKDSHSEEEGDL